jgi:hypothetical protein
VRALIGDRAERLAYLFCAIDYDSFDEEVKRGAPPFRFLNRFTAAPIEVSEGDFNDVVKLQLVDRLEQLPRSKEWGFRRESFQRMAERLGPHAQAQFEKVFALETR